MNADPRLRPIGLLRSAAYFGVPATVFSVSLLGLLPWMVRAGLGGLAVFAVAFSGPLVLLLCAALIAYRLEGRAWTWESFRDRMRLRRLSGRDWLWTVALIVASPLLGLVVSPLVDALSAVQFYTAPPELVGFMSGISEGRLGGTPLLGRWDILLWTVLVLVVFNIGGEELWWRGVILPRQELAFGRWAWLVNGLLWNLFHVFYHADLGSVVAYLPITLPLAFVAQRTRSTWPGVIAHLVSNGAFAVVLLRGVIG